MCFFIISLFPLLPSDVVCVYSVKHNPNALATLYNVMVTPVKLFLLSFEIWSERERETGTERERGAFDLTSSLGDDLQICRHWSIAHGRVGQHLDVVSLIGCQALDGEKVGGSDDLLLPLVDGLRGVAGIVDSVAHDLPIGLLRLVPVDDGSGAAQHTTSDLSGGGAGRLLGRLGLDGVAGRPAADVVDRHHAELVVGVWAEAAHAVAGRGHAVDLLVRVFGVLGLVLDDVVGHGLRVARVPREGDACRSALRYHGDAWGLGQS